MGDVGEHLDGIRVNIPKVRYKRYYNKRSEHLWTTAHDRVVRAKKQPVLRTNRVWLSPLHKVIERWTRHGNANKLPLPCPHKIQRSNNDLAVAHRWAAGERRRADENTRLTAVGHTREGVGTRSPLQPTPEAPLRLPLLRAAHLHPLPPRPDLVAYSGLSRAEPAPRGSTHAKALHTHRALPARHVGPTHAAPPRETHARARS